MYYDGYNIADEEEKRSFLMKLRMVYRREGLFVLLKKILIFTIFRIDYYLFAIDYAIFNRYFIVGNKKIQYFINIYNAVQNERVIEIPFAKEYLFKSENKDVLKIGNVLSHYFNVHHTIVDKYEKTPGVIDIDILDFNSDEKYDLIISISTIEHIGFDEPIKENGKSEKAMLKIIELLNNKGTALITVPLGYNPEIDSILKNNLINFTERHFLKRVSKWNLWKETTLEDALKYKYGSKGLTYPTANSVAFLLYKKE